MSRKSQEATRARIRAVLADPRNDEPAALVAIEAVLAAPPTLVLEQRPSGPLIGRGDGMVAVVDKAGAIKWRRADHTRGGRPTAAMPIEIEVRLAETAFIDSIAAAERDVRALAASRGQAERQQAAAGRASAAARQSTKVAIEAELQTRDPTSGTVGVIARKLGVSPRHVRATRQSAEKRK